MRTRLPLTIAASTLLLAATGCGLLAEEGETPERDASSGQVTEAVDANVFEIAVGDCLPAEGPSGEVASLEVVPCSEPHGSEVYFSHQMEDAEEFPGSEAVTAAAAEHCLPAFQEFVGVAYEESVLEVTTLEPTEQTWAEGDRELLCIIVDTEGAVTGTLEGANR
ncbi:septum formation family protein [Thalassiella azotivora]